MTFPILASLLVRLVVLLPFQLLRLSLASPSRWTPLALSVFLHCVVALLFSLLSLHDALPISIPAARDTREPRRGLSLPGTGGARRARPGEGIAPARGARRVASRGGAGPASLDCGRGSASPRRGGPSARGIGARLATRLPAGRA